MTPRERVWVMLTERQKGGKRVLMWEDVWGSMWVGRKDGRWEVMLVDVWVWMRERKRGLKWVIEWGRLKVQLMVFVWADRSVVMMEQLRGYLKVITMGGGRVQQREVWLGLQLVVSWDGKWERKRVKLWVSVKTREFARKWGM